MSADVQEMTVESIKVARDRKLAIVLRDKHPAWIVSERVRLASNDCVFDVVFRYSGHWAQRRYIYDAEVDVLHFNGETLFDGTQLHTLLDEMLFKPPV
jgi:hypothetical protein